MGNAFDKPFEALNRFCARYRADAEVRARIARGDTSDLDLELPEGTEVRVMEQTADTFYFPLPPKPGAAVSDEALNAVSGGATISISEHGAGHVPPCLDGACHQYLPSELEEW